MRRAIKLLVLLCSLSAAINMMAQTTVHNVRPGDTFESVAARYGVAVEALIQANPYTQKCYVGAQLMIPSVEKSVPAKNNDKQTSGATISLEKKVQPVASNTVAKKPVTPAAVKNEDQPLDPYELIDQGVALMGDGKYLKAKRAFTKALKIKSLPEAYYYRGICNYKKSKWKTAYKDLYIAKGSSSLDSKMKKEASQLYSKAYDYHKEKVERRRETWAAIGEAVGTTLLAVGAVAAETMVAATSYGDYSSYNSGYSPSMSTSASLPAQDMSYLLDPNYAMAQVQQAEYQEYQQVRQSYQQMGKDLTLDEFRQIKGQAIMMSNQETGSITETNDNISGGSYDPRDTYRRWEKQAESIYDSLTIGGGTVKTESGKSHGVAGEIWTHGGTYSSMQMLFRDAQKEMRRVREEAAAMGINITPSEWETRTISF